MQSSRTLRQLVSSATPIVLTSRSALVWQRAVVDSLRLNRCSQSSRLYSIFRQPIPSDPHAQVQYLRQLNQQGEAEAVISLYEAGNVAVNEATLGEYVKALVKLDRLNTSALFGSLQQGAFAREVRSLGQSPSNGAGSNGFGSFAESALRSAGAKAGADLGSAKNPVHTLQAEPSMKAQLWRTLRTLGVAFVVLSGLGALLEDRAGLSRGILNNPDMRPQLETNTKFKDVKGVDEAKAELEEVVHFLKNPSKFTSLGGKLPKGVLLVGPPGTGKTMLARAIAGEAGVPFFYCSGSEFEEMFVGVGARRVRDLFAAAKKHAPCIIFLDEIDAIGGSRNPKDQQYMKMTLNQLLVELDGFNPSEGVIVIAATNFPESLDKALVRPGRFDRHVVVPNPDVKGRREILESHFKNIPRAPDVDLQVIARGTSGFSGADLANLVNIAALQSASMGAGAVTMAALEFAKDRIMMGTERKSAVISESDRRLTAYHEGGHALVALHTDGAHPVHKATIVPRGMALGMVMQLPEEADEHSVSRRQLLARLDICMGGRVAEEIIFGPNNVTTGASSDFEQATRLARAMVTKYGMSEKVGRMSISDEEVLSSEMRAEVEKEVQTLVNSAYQRAKDVLKGHEKELHLIAGELLEKETLSGQQIKDMLAKFKNRTAAA